MALEQVANFCVTSFKNNVFCNSTDTYKDYLKRVLFILNKPAICLIVTGRQVGRYVAADPVEFSRSL